MTRAHLGLSTGESLMGSQWASVIPDLFLIQYMTQEMRWMCDLPCSAGHKRPAKVSKVMIPIYKDVIAGACQKVNFQLISTAVFTVFLSSHPTWCKFALHYLRSIPQIIMGHCILAICTESWWRQCNCSFYCQLGKPHTAPPPCDFSSSKCHWAQVYSPW